MKVLFIALFIFTQAMAQITMQDCRIAAQQYGSQTSIPIKIPKACASLVTTKKSHTNFDQSFDQSSNQLIEIYGHENILLTKIFKINETEEKTLQSEHFIAGEKTMLSEIISVKINQADKKIYVLNKTNGNYNILSYFYQHGGNNVPSRKLISDEINGAYHFTIDNEVEELFIISHKEAWVKVFNRDADPDGPRVKNSVQIKRKIQGNNTQLSSPSDIEVSQNQIFILDTKRILIFDKNAQGNTAPVQILNDENIEQAQKIKIQNDQLIIHTQNDKSYTYSINE